MYHGEYTLKETVILTQLNLNMQARDLERMKFLLESDLGRHLVLVEPLQPGLRDWLGLAHLGGEDGGGESGILLVLGGIIYNHRKYLSLQKC